MKTIKDIIEDMQIKKFKKEINNTNEFTFDGLKALFKKYLYIRACNEAYSEYFLTAAKIEKFNNISKYQVFIRNHNGRKKILIKDITNRILI